MKEDNTCSLCEELKEIIFSQSEVNRKVIKLCSQCYKKYLSFKSKKLSTFLAKFDLK